MSSIEVPDEIAVRLREEARRRGVAVDQLLAALIQGLPAEDANDRAAPGFIALGASTSGRTARDADDLPAEGFGR